MYVYYKDLYIYSVTIGTSPISFNPYPFSCMKMEFVKV